MLISFYIILDIFLSLQIKNQNEWNNYVKSCTDIKAFIQH